MGPVNVAASVVTEPKFEGRARGIGVKTPITVGLATAHGMSVVAAHGGASRSSGGRLSRS